MVFPATMLTPVTGPDPQPAAVWNVAPGEVDCSVSAVSLPRLDALPNVSCSCTVVIAEQFPAVRVWGGVRKAIFTAAAGLTVTPWLALVRPVAEAVTDGLPALVSR